MSEENVFEFPTTAGEEESKEINVEEMAAQQEGNAENIVGLVNKRRKGSLETLQKSSEDFKFELNQIPSESRPVMILKDDGDNLAWSLENQLRNISKALDSVTTNSEAVNSMLDMIVNDLQGCAMQVNQLAQATWTTNAHLQTLLTVLKSKGAISEDELKSTWETLVKAAQTDSPPA